MMTMTRQNQLAAEQAKQKYVKIALLAVFYRSHSNATNQSSWIGSRINIVDSEWFDHIFMRYLKTHVYTFVGPNHSTTLELTNQPTKGSQQRLPLFPYDLSVFVSLPPATDSVNETKRSNPSPTETFTLW
jgi:hypothetical protein